LGGPLSDAEGTPVTGVDDIVLWGYLVETGLTKAIGCFFARYRNELEVMVGGGLAFRTGNNRLNVGWR
jgi:hypothetical protein